MSEETSDSEVDATLQRQGDPLEGLWHWSDHPIARVGIVTGILFGIVFCFIVLAQFGWF